MKRSHKTVDLSKSFVHQLNMYALAASAAGVGLLALVQPAEGRIVYTHTNKKIVNGLTIDLNHDGITDFTLSFSRKSTGGGDFASYLHAVPAGMNGVVSSGKYAADLPSGAEIDSQQNFASAPKIMVVKSYSSHRSVCFGPWDDKKRYLGFKFDIEGKLHYGWARLGVWCNKNYDKGKIFGHLTGYAYETIPNKPIITGKTKGPDVITIHPGSLGHLARGAPAIPAWRRKDQ